MGFLSSNNYRRGLALASILVGVLASPVVRFPEKNQEFLQEGLASKSAWQEGQTPIWVTNRCQDKIWPALLTQKGSGPGESGFELEPGKNKQLSVSDDWQGRVWGRTNCTFNDAGTGPRGGTVGGKACRTGDCGGKMNCDGTGELPVGLAEFNLDGGDGLTYFDISLVDGYNVPIAINPVMKEGTDLGSIAPNLFAPSCIANVGYLESKDFDPYIASSEPYLGTNSSFGLTFETKMSYDDVLRWCPWDLQESPPSKPADGSFSYPDGNVDRPFFNPCFSACAHSGSDEDCCKGDFNDAKKCKPNSYAKVAKKVCPDAYSFAYDDQYSTFPLPKGAGFEITFCPAGRSTNILATNREAVLAASHHHRLAHAGLMSDAEVLEEAQEASTEKRDVISPRQARPHTTTRVTVTNTKLRTVTTRLQTGSHIPKSTKSIGVTVDETVVTVKTESFPLDYVSTATGDPAASASETVTKGSPLRSSKADEDVAKTTADKSSSSATPREGIKTLSATLTVTKRSADVTPKPEKPCNSCGTPITTTEVYAVAASATPKLGEPDMAGVPAGVDGCKAGEPCSLETSKGPVTTKIHGAKPSQKEPVTTKIYVKGTTTKTVHVTPVTTAIYVGRASKTSKTAKATKTKREEPGTTKKPSSAKSFTATVTESIFEHTATVTKNLNILPSTQSMLLTWKTMTPKPKPKTTEKPKETAKPTESEKPKVTKRATTASLYGQTENAPSGVKFTVVSFVTTVSFQDPTHTFGPVVDVTSSSKKATGTPRTKIGPVGRPSRTAVTRPEVTKEATSVVKVTVTEKVTEKAEPTSKETPKPEAETKEEPKYDSTVVITSTVQVKSGEASKTNIAAASPAPSSTESKIPLASNNPPSTTPQPSSAEAEPTPGITTTSAAAGASGAEAKPTHNEEA